MARDNALLRVLAQMALTALVIGTSVAAASTERVTASLVLTSSIAWAFVPLIQLATGLWFVRAASPGARGSALAAYFDTHRPWSLFILAFHAMILMWPASRGFTLMLAPAGVIPIGLTAVALVRLGKNVLGLSAGAARRNVAVHQAMTYVIVAAYAAWASAYLPRLMGLAG